jgi:hypothetical protein
MTLRIRHLRLRSETSSGTFGADIPFALGLNVLWADNTKGKSTCLQGLLYALGLERMLSPRREIPLTYVMTSHLDNPDTGAPRTVLESSVSVELENAFGDIITVRRGVKSAQDRRLVTVSKGPALSEPTARYQSQDYFVLDPGAAQREAGFHRMVADFIAGSCPGYAVLTAVKQSSTSKPYFPCSTSSKRLAGHQCQRRSQIICKFVMLAAVRLNSS